jgi:hypothetical protein
MNKNFILYILLLFMALSVWLSIKIKKANDLIEISQTRQKAVSDNYAKLQYQLDILLEAFQINFRMNPEQLLSAGLPDENPTTNSIVLHLKPYACSPCNMPAITALARHFEQDKGFYIISHQSNEYFLSELTNELGHDNVVIWLESNLYNHTDDGYDAELLFLNSEKLITGKIPLELLKDSYIFDLLLQGLDKVNNN